MEYTITKIKKIKIEKTILMIKYKYQDITQSLTFM